MLGHRTLTVEDYTKLLKKRGWIIVLPAILLSIVGGVIAHFVPPLYVSQTLVLIEQPTVPGDIVRSVVSEDLNSRLASMKEQILSRSRLEPIITQFSLYSASKMPMDDRIDQVRKDIDIKPIRSDISHTGGLPGFFISFRASDPHTAQQVCGQITTLFINENIRSRNLSAQGTTDFLQSQLDDAKRNLDEQDAKLADFQREYMGRLPEEEGPNMNMLTSLNTQLGAATQQLTTLQNQRSYAETMLAAETRDQPDSGQAVQPQAQQQQLQALLTQEADLTTRYMDDYPDVISVRRKIKELRDQMAKAPPPSSSTPKQVDPNRPEPMNIVQLRGQIKAMDVLISQKVKEQGQIQAQVSTYQGRVASSPQVQEEYKTVTRDHQAAQAFYDDLMNKMNSSRMAMDLEKRQQGEQFRLMDAPNLPEEPSYPKRSVFLGAGFMAGLGLGLLVVGWLEYRDTALRSERDVWAFTHLPTLAVIALTSDDGTPRKRSWFGGRKKGIPPAGQPLTN